LVFYDHKNSNNHLFFKVCWNRVYPSGCRGKVTAAKGRIKFAARLALRKSAAKIQKSVEASTDESVLQQNRLRIIDELKDDLTKSALHAIGHHHESCRETCPRPVISPDLVQAVDEVRETLCRENVTAVVTTLCERFPELLPKKVTFIQETRRVLDEGVSTESALYHAYGDHTRCHQKCSQRPLEICDDVKKALTVQTEYLTEKAHRLVENLDSNVNESFAAVTNMLFSGRRTNLQGRGGTKRQAILAGLTMSRGYKWHAAAQRAMNLRPSKVLDDYAEYINQRRKRAKENTKPRWRKRLAKTGGYQKEAADDILPPELTELIDERLQRMEQFDVEKAKKLVDVDSHQFMDAVGDRMLSETVAAICVKKSSNNNVNEFLKNVKLTPWHVTNDKKEKVVAEMVMKGGSVTSCGLFVCATNKCFAAKPDGVIFGLKICNRAYQTKRAFKRHVLDHSELSYIPYHKQTVKCSVGMWGNSSKKKFSQKHVQTDL
jgi:hypothetical protein